MKTPNIREAINQAILKYQVTIEEHKAKLREFHKGGKNLVVWIKNNKTKMAEYALAASLKQAKKVNQLDLNGNFIKEWFSAAEASRVTKTPQNSISKCAKGKQSASNGFKWEYVK